MENRHFLVKMNVQVWVSGKNYAYVFSVKERGMEKSWEKVKKFGRQARFQRKGNGYPTMYAHACSFKWKHLGLCFKLEVSDQRAHTSVSIEV